MVALPEPLQVVVCAGGRGEPGEPFADAVVGAFRGSRDGYLAGADDLDVQVREFYATPAPGVGEVLSAALHTLVVVLVSDRLIRNAAFVKWIDDCAGLIGAAGSPHRLLVLDLDSTIERFFNAAPNAGWSQARLAASLGERAIQPTVTALVALHRCMEAVTAGSRLLPDKLSMFVSHAKADGLPLARALTAMIDELPDFKTFYDARNIPWGADWRRTLEDGVRDSVVIVLRSEIYESRGWCQQEMLWADEFASPVVVVDLRSNPIAPPSRLGFDQAPSLRVPDGNLYRIIYMALREGLRARLHVRRVQWLIDEGHLERAATEIVVRQPTMNALRATCERSADRSALTVLYPDPPMLDGQLDGAEALVRHYSPNFRLTTPETFISAGGAAS